MIDSRVLADSQAYVDTLVGPGAGERHTAFLDSLDDEALREAVHRCHLMQADTTELSVEENYLLGMVVLAASHYHGPAAMFARVLLHRGVRKEKLLAAMTRLAMWIGPIPAAVAVGHVQRAIRDFEENGPASLAAWFPEPPTAERNGGSHD